jgi:hypothetical protein
MNTWRNCFRLLALVLGTGWLVASTGCYEYRAIPVGDVRPQDHIRVTRSDSSQTVLEHPVLRGDTLAGTRPLTQEQMRAGMWRSADSVRIPLADVRQVSKSSFSPGRTVGLVAGMAAGTVGLGVILLCLGGWCGG